MSSPPIDRTPRQERSRATAERLLAVTLQLLDSEGLEAAVIPRIAAAAQLAPASIYRRFGDKNGLLRAAFLRMLAQSLENSQVWIGGMLPRGALEGTVRQLITLLMGNYEKHPRLMAAFNRFLNEDQDADFIRQAQETIRASGDLAVDLLLRHHGDAIAHAEPRLALRFMLHQATTTIASYSLDPRSLWHADPAWPAAVFREQLVQMAVAYLTRGSDAGEARPAVLK